MKSHLHLDIETYSECDLGAAGVYKYAEHPSTELLCFSYAFDDEPVLSWRPGHPLPARLRDHIQNREQVRAHNAQFERVVLNGIAGKKIGFPHISIEQTVCTAAKMAAHGLPRALGAAASALGAAEKSLEGRIIMLQLCKPRKNHADGRYTPTNAPDKFEVLYSYCEADVEAERDIDRRVPDLSPAEQQVYELDQKINERGIAVDLKAIADIQAVIAEYKDFLRDTLAKLTKCSIAREKIAIWVRDNGWPGLTDMQAATVKALLARPDVPADVKKVLTIYSTYNLKAVTKYDAILEAVCADGKLRGMFMYHGAATGRWSSLIVQLQNLFRPVIDDPETAVEAFSARSLETLRWLYAGVDPMKVAASCVRSVFVASPGKDLLFPDYAGIESRVNAWLFGEEWKLEAFRAQDAGTGPDTYKLAYARAFQVAIDKVTKSQRQIGKVCIAEGTLVLCEQGWKRIEDISVKDKVWDGEEWAQHNGLSDNGLRPTVEIYGSWLTPDHLVWCGHAWKRTDWLLAKKDQALTHALAFAADTLLSPAMLRARQNTPSLCSSLSATAAVRSFRWLRAAFASSHPRDVSFAEMRKPTQREKPFGNTPMQCPSTNTGADFAHDWRRPLLVATVKLPRSFPHMVEEGLLFATNGEKISAAFLGIFRPLKAGFADGSDQQQPRL